MKVWVSCKKPFVKAMAIFSMILKVSFARHLHSRLRYEIIISRTSCYVLQKKLFSKLHKNYRKTTVLESLFNKVASVQKRLKRSSTVVVKFQNFVAKPIRVFMNGCFTVIIR